MTDRGDKQNMESPNAARSVALSRNGCLSISPQWSVGADQEVSAEQPQTLLLDGGVDVTMLCDPKTNVKGEPKINHWADVSEIEQVVEFSMRPGE